MTMPLLQSLKSYIYDLVTRSRVIWYLLPIFYPIIGFLFYINLKNEDYITDESGTTMRVTKWNGKIYPAFGKKRLSTTKDINIRKNDVIISGYPKTGSHWSFEIVQMLIHKKAILSKYGKGLEGMLDAMPDFLLDSLPSPRVMNSHFLYNDLPRGVKEKKIKIVVTIRNPKDTVVSFYHHTKNLHKVYAYDGTFENYFKMFVKGELDYGDYFEYYLNWNKATKTQKDNAIFFLEFEALKENPVATIIELADFLGVAITKEFAEEVANVSSFKNMQKKRSSLMFRKGVVGDWKNTLTEEQNTVVDRLWREKMTGFKLTYSQCQLST